MKRLYVQLKPDSAGIVHLRSLVPAGAKRVVPDEKLHLTLIHFGVVSEVRSKLPCDDQTFDTALRTYVHESNQIIRGFACMLRPTGFARFGHYGHVLAVTYEPTPELAEKHRLLYEKLLDFAFTCGVDESFLRRDANFEFAHTLKPHITLAKIYNGPLPLCTLQPISLKADQFGLGSDRLYLS